MKITKRFLETKDACDEGMEWFSNNNPFKSDIDCIKKLMKNEIIIYGDDERYNWSNWIICRIFNREQRIKYAIYAAEQVLHIFEKEYTDDKRPREAINAAKKVLESNTKKNRDAANNAADAVAYVAYNAAYNAANAAAYNAANAAAYAAYAAFAAAADSAYADAYATAAADAAADVVADAVAKEKLQIKILNYGLRLLK